MTGTAGSILFLVAAVLAVATALGTVLARRPLRSAIFLLTHLGSLALIYLTLHAELLAAIQLLVYAGAILVLFVFVIMLIGPTDAAPSPFRSVTPRLFAATGVGMLTLAVASVVGRTEMDVPEVGEGFGGVVEMGFALFRGAAVPFELVAVTLTVAVLGVIGIARGRTAVEAAALAEAAPDAVAANVSEAKPE
jgi:NADH-quinone oxidoreductase subunit J